MTHQPKYLIDGTVKSINHSQLVGYSHI